MNALVFITVVIWTGIGSFAEAADLEGGLSSYINCAKSFKNSEHIYFSPDKKFMALRCNGQPQYEVFSLCLYTPTGAYIYSLKPSKLRRLGFSDGSDINFQINIPEIGPFSGRFECPLGRMENGVEGCKLLQTSFDPKSQTINGKSALDIEPETSLVPRIVSSLNQNQSDDRAMSGSSDSMFKTCWETKHPLIQAAILHLQNPIAGAGELKRRKISNHSKKSLRTGPPPVENFQEATFGTAAH